MDDRQFRRVLEALGYSFEGYRRVRKGVKKRLRRHMRALGCRTMEAYLDRLAASREVHAACIRRMAVPISRFWRDRDFWESLQTFWLPALQQRFGRTLAAWSAGCACGEEAYSLAMAERESRVPGPPENGALLVIMATDLNPVVLAKARAGVYPASSLREVPAHLVDRYFVPLRRRRRYRIRSELFGNIHWRRQAIEAASSEGPFHLILLRNNVLTYRDDAGRRGVLAQVAAQLHPGGLLAIGWKESLPIGMSGLTPAAAALPCLYLKTDRVLVHPGSNV